MFDFTSRATRAEYWWFSLTGGIAACILFAIFAIVALNMAAESILGFDRYLELFATPSSGGLPDNPYYLTYFYSGMFIGIFPLIAIQWRRIHDIGLSGWWFLLSALLGLFQNIYIDVPVGIIFLYLLGFKRGDAYTNKFGPSPISFDEHSSSHESIAPRSQLKNLKETDAKFYNQALAELESGERDSGIWAKAYAETSDDESSKRLYVRLRADALRLEQKADERTGPAGFGCWTAILVLLMLFVLVAALV